MKAPIQLTNVRQNNLKGFSVDIPQGQFTVITGLSGSGKSSLAFDTLYAEGQRRYVESLSTYTRQFLAKMPKPDVESVKNIPPAIALEQRNHVMNSRSTVGTQTEVLDYLRILFARIGETQCENCGGVVRRWDRESILNQCLQWLPNRKAILAAPYTVQKKAKTQPSAVFKVLMGQGYGRILVPEKKSYRVINLDDPDETKGLKTLPDPILIVTDRLRLSGPADDESRLRISDSLAQALAIGRGKVLMFDAESGETKELDQRFACVDCGKEYREPQPHLFSFNSPLGACDHCSGFGHTLDLDESKVILNAKLSLKEGAFDPFTKPSLADEQKDLFKLAKTHKISLDTPFIKLPGSQKAILWKFAEETFEGLKRWKYKLHVRVFIRRYQSAVICSVCKGARLKPDALAVKLGGKNLPEVLALPLTEHTEWLKGLKLSPTQRKTAADLLKQLDRRVSLLIEVGVGYLTLDRLAKTLSGGEFQRINLATQLGNGLCGTLYVLDEPSIGLHAADTDRLIGVLKLLRDQGNTVVVVEHDVAVMKAADYLIELGPGAGLRGGSVVAAGIPSEFRKHSTLTAEVLKLEIPLKPERPIRGPGKRFLKILGCAENNLKNIDVQFPLDRLVVVTGLSGSGKSTLIHKTLYPALQKHWGEIDPDHLPGKFDRMYGVDQLAGVLLMDQSPIGRSSRSNPATYMKAWDEVRRIYSNQALSLRRGYTPQYFSFNVDGGRCATCKGEGEITLDMHFMAEVRLPCEECEGRRFKKAVLDVSYKNKNIYELLQSTVDEAFDLFRDQPILHRKLGLLRDVGLGYLGVGQSGNTLSGGESQRLKIAATLEGEDRKNRLYLFDEPTTGLHPEDVKRLLRVIQDLIDCGNSVIMIEHQLDVIREADWIIDLGPEGGKNGGALVAEGTPEDLVLNPHSITGQMLVKQGYFNREAVFRARRG